MRTATFLLLLFIAGGLIAQPDTHRLDSLMRVMAEDDSFNGNVMIARDGEVVYQRSFGYKNLDTKTELNTETSFRLASVSKQFTALGIALLENEGKLSYDDPLAKYIPEFAHYEGVTIRHLLHHYGGLPDYMNLVMRKGEKEKVYDNELTIALMADKKPKREFAPGTSFSYSNSGYLALASVIERVSGQTFAEFLHERVFEPLGMNRTAVNFPTTRPDDDNVAAGFQKQRGSDKYIRVDNGNDPYGFGVLADIVGDGAVFSTTGDLLKYHLGMQTDLLLSTEKRKVLTVAGELEKAPDQGYAFGQQVRKTEDLGMRFSHSGSWAGALTYLERYPEHGAVIVILSNTNSSFSNARLLGRQFLAGNPLALPEKFIPIALSAEQLKGYAGAYPLSEDMTLIISTKKDELRMKPTGQPDYLMTAFSPEGFFLEDTSISIVFKRNVKGEVTGLTFTQDGNSQECKKQ